MVLDAKPADEADARSAGSFSLPGHLIALLREYTKPASLSEGAAYKHLAAFLVGAIQNNRLPHGMTLPSERILATITGLSRTTVRAAYHALALAGLAEVRPNVGTVVIAASAVTKTSNAAFRRALARDGIPITGNFLSDLMRGPARHPVYSFELGMPDPEMLPTSEFQLVLSELVQNRMHAATAYSATEGHVALRERLVTYLKQYRGITNIGPENVLITTGSIQAISLIANAFIDPGDHVVIEEPTFPGAIDVFTRAKARLLPVPLDANGMQIGDLERSLSGVSKRCKLVYIQPTIQNPTGIIMSAKRRQELCALAYGCNAIILEDDAYGILDPTPGTQALYANRGDASVIYVGTFSKLLAPGLRVGFVVADPGVIRHLMLIKQSADLHSSGLSQLLIEGWLALGDVAGYVRRCRETYASRIALALADPFFQECAEVPLLPRAGFYIFGRLKNGGVAIALKETARAAGVSFLSGESFSVWSPLHSAFRLSLGYIHGESISVGLSRLRRVFLDDLRSYV